MVFSSAGAVHLSEVKTHVNEEDKRSLGMSYSLTRGPFGPIRDPKRQH